MKDVLQLERQDPQTTPLPTVKPRTTLARWWPIPLRLIVGYGFMQHGLAKLSRGPEIFAGILNALGVPAPHFMAWLTVGTEIFGGLAIPLLVAIFTVHLPYGFSSSSCWP